MAASPWRILEFFEFDFIQPHKAHHFASFPLRLLPAAMPAESAEQTTVATTLMDAPSVDSDDEIDEAAQTIGTVRPTL